MSKAAFSTGRMVRLAVLVAIIIIMSFTPLGFLPVGPLSLTLLPIPVAVGAILFGPGVGAALGGLFGILSFVRALLGQDIGPILLPISPIGTFIVCVVPRILEGWLTGLVFKALNRIDRTKIASYAVSGFLTAAFNTIFFMGGLMLLFWKSYIAPFATSSGVTGSAFTVIFFVMGVVAVQAVVEAALCAVIGGSVSKVLMRYFPEKKSAKET
jgi:uncharacterized membrane protein